jgi:hypothetical protein
MHRLKFPLALLVVGLAVALTSCQYARQLQNAVTNLKRCTFKLAGVSNFRLAGVALAGKNSLSDFSVLGDGLTLAQAFANKQLPADFTLNVAAINPNDGTGGSSQTTASLTSFAWTMIIDNTMTVNGDIDRPIDIPGTGQQSIIPLKMGVDLVKFFGNRGYESIVKLALAMGGAKGSASSITLRAKPRLHTSLGDIEYPGMIDVVDKEFRN